jgi:hypothetical protein
MAKQRSREEWAATIEAAVKSGLKISEFCRKNDIAVNHFYRYALLLGYTSGGKRTEKWFTTASGASEKSVPSMKDNPALVPVPVQTVRMAWESTDVSPAQSQISIFHDSFRIDIGEGFSQDTLRRVLEVVRNA